MIGSNLSRSERRADARAIGTEGKRWIRSWINVFRCETEARVPADEARLAELLREGKFSCVGKSHSYNGVQVVPGVTAMMMREGGLTTLSYDPTTETVRVGASVSVRDLKLYLRDEHGRGLHNSGNYMEQSVIGALATGTHGFGPRAVMADSIVELTFLDGAGQRVTLKRGEPDFAYVALSFGTIAPIVELVLETKPLEPYVSVSSMSRLSKLDELKQGSIAANWAVLPYTDKDDPVIMLHALAECDKEQEPPAHPEAKGGSGWFAKWFLKRYYKFDKFLPWLRRPLQRFIDWLDLKQSERVITDPGDLDYLYDPKPGLKENRAPSITRGLFSTTYTGYNLAFFVPLEKAPAVVKYIIREADALRDLGFFLKGIVSVRELPGEAGLHFAANARRSMAAIDLFADPRDYAWLERLQRLVMHYEPATRPHFGKSALGPEFCSSLDQHHLDELMKIHRKHFPQGNLMFSERVRAMLDVGRPLAGESVAAAGLA
ncbi:FAD-binding protein [Erythrobacter sp.]|uniref:FAD-binding protein n=1 Tax=Erythrobacter sp. TaxID=1042 RepID=UPI001B2C60D4|nr:FAD-binding protein [Erythrobacter sp.]MBO6526227.1 FAD-binding protein [Erythrobacter sp.]MBO6530480.1 FAD-binding protein [Erythrobacter sp.]